jgi:hypothetical protein
MTAQPTAHTAAGVRGRALLAALGLALAAAVLPAAVAHASPQSPDVENQLANPGGTPQPPEPPDPPQWGPQDLANPTENPEPEPPSRPSARTTWSTPPRSPSPRTRTRLATPTRPVTARSRPRSVWTPASAVPPSGPTRPPALP